jgi:hypothetical protein
MDRFSRVCLVLIVLFLAVTAFHPILAPSPVHASRQYPERPAPVARYTEYDAYVIGESNVNDLSKALTLAAAGGWEVIGVTSMPDFQNGSGAVLVLLAK